MNSKKNIVYDILYCIALLFYFSFIFFTWDNINEKYITLGRFFSATAAFFIAIIKYGDELPDDQSNKMNFGKKSAIMAILSLILALLSIVF